MEAFTARERGFALVTAGVCALAAFGALGLAVDIGRLYIIRNEAQVYADSAALAAAAQLDGASAGLARALDAVAANTNRWNLGASAFSGAQVDFATAADGPWQANPPAAGFRFVRVRASVTAQLYFLPAVSSKTSTTVSATAVAGQIPRTSFTEGLMPFSPIAHSGVGPDFGFTPGERYTLRWGSNPRVNRNTCSGDNEQQWIDQAQAGGHSERGYIEETGAAAIRKAIETGYQSRTLALGDLLNMTNGDKNSLGGALENRVWQDTDSHSHTFAAYAAGGAGNGRRLVAIAINSGFPENRILGFALFFLLTACQYDAHGNEPFCAEYVGPYVEGSREKGAGSSGAYVVRLVS